MAERNQKFNTSSLKTNKYCLKSTNPKSLPIADNTTNELKEEESLKQKEQLQLCENYIVFWLDSNAKSLNEKTTRQIRSIVNAIKSFDNIDDCIRSLAEINDEKIFLIVSNSLAQYIVPFVQSCKQVDSVHILSDHELVSQKLTATYIKIKGVYTDIKSLCNKLREIIQQSNNALIPISIVSPSFGDNPDKLPASFMYFQLFKECALTLPSDTKMEKSELVDYVTPSYQGNHDETALIEQFKMEYAPSSSIQWYTKECFLYKMLNSALRLFNIKTLMKMSFIIRDLHEEIKSRHSQANGNQQISLVYRGQFCSIKQLEYWKKSKNGLISFEQFLSTSTKQAVADNFIRYKPPGTDLTRILFKIKIKSLNSTVPFASIRESSDFSSEDEILFSVSTVFRIDEIHQIEDDLWEIGLTLTDDRDPLLARLMEHMRVSLGNGNSWYRLGQLMIKMGQFKQAEKIYKNLLDTTLVNDKAERSFLYNQLGFVFKQMNNLPEALSHYEKSLNISRSYMPSSDSRLSSIYSNIGGIFKELNQLDTALKIYQHVLQLDSEVSESNPLEIAIDYNNIGSVLDEQNKYKEALDNYEKALEIKLDYLPPYHASLAIAYSNIGLIHRKMGSQATERQQYESACSFYNKALSCYEQALNVQEKSLPPNHPSFIVTHSNMAKLYEMQKNYSKAAEHEQKAKDISKVALVNNDSE